MTAPPPDQPGLFPEAPAAGLKGFSENELVEQPAIDLFEELGWQTANLYQETFGPQSSEGRESRREVLLPRRLRVALERLNPDVPPQGIWQAIDALARDRSTMLPVQANREVYDFLKEGVKAQYRDERDEEVTRTVRLIDWRNPEANDFFLAAQFWVAGELYTRRCDLVGFVNGIPLLHLEAKAVYKSAKDAYDGNLADYLDAVPHLFLPNAFVILSNGADTRVGSAFAPWDHFFEWKRINDEGEEGVVSLETAIRGLCDRRRFLDYVENFIVYQEERGGLVKKPAKNHQYLGVCQAIHGVQKLGENRGRLGVFWHTQGSGKSLSMVYFAQKVLRALPGNWTFVVVTDRQELDDQIAKTFVATGAVTKELQLVQAQSRDHLKQLLTGDERYVFTLIQKFGTGLGETYPKLSDRSDIIVMTDEAHRSQYDILAANMRRALPNAAFIGFTGTPLMAGEELTREVFGDYVSTYNFARSIEDKATVPLYYENRIPELQISNADLGDDLARLLDEAELDEEQEKKLERDFARQYHIITRDDRLERIADDVVKHFVGRGYRGKAMFIALDKATAVRMYDKVRRYWAAHIAALEARRPKADEDERAELDATIAWMRETDMAVVVSQSQNEIAEMKAKGLDILPHRKRMVTEDLDENFKDPSSPFRLVFICAMWITGFDVPSCSTIYLDKPMKNHSLMQAIARANRVMPGKTAGVIVDYVGVFRNLQKALAIYAQPGVGGGSPVEDKAALVGRLKTALEETVTFCGRRNVMFAPILAAQAYARVKLIGDGADALMGNDNERAQFLQLANDVWKLYKAVLPDERAVEFASNAVVTQVLAERIRSLMPKADITVVRSQIEGLLDRSIAGVRIAAPIRDHLDGLFNLSRIDFEKLAKLLKGGRTRSKVQALRTGIERKLADMVRQNPARMVLLERFQEMIDEYNAGSLSAEELLKQLLDFVKSLSDEEQRAVREALSEEELAIFDILTKPEPKLSRQDEIEVKKVARSLLEKLKREKLVLDWRRKEQARAGVRQTIGIELDTLPPAYTTEIYRQKCDLAYQYVFEHYPEANSWTGATGTLQ